MYLNKNIKTNILNNDSGTKDSSDIKPIFE